MAFLGTNDNLDMSYEINCIASIVQSYNWKRVILVYEDNMYGGEYVAFSLLFEALQKIGSIIEHRVVIPHLTSPFDSKEVIRENLVDVLTTKQSRVFIVLKSSLLATTRVFEEANKLGLMEEDSAWILGESFSSLLDSFDPSVFKLIQGALGVKAYYSDKSAQFLDFKSKFKTAYRSNYQEEDKLEPGIYAIRAYDSIERISLALDHLEKLKDRDGEKLLEMIQSTNLSSLTGKIHLQDETPSV
ncbi:glutamate receptor 2.7-like [Bidens hawaiensis]|uniref:glutamate receptor 2.7-like n=1 Tax=Bidens hawaiensis TaxID=980011 RepID=UPI004049A3C1